MIASDVEPGKYVVSHIVKEKSNVTIDAAVSCDQEGRTFNGIDIKVTNVILTQA